MVKCWNAWLNLVGRQRSLILSEMRRVTFLSLSQSPGVDWLFKNFCWVFYSHFWDRSGSEKFWRGKFMTGWKKNSLNCTFIFTFQPDGCAEATCTVTCFIHFGLSHRPVNIRLMLPFFNRKLCSWCFSSSSSYRAGSTDIPDPLSPLLPIVHRPR